MKKVTCYGTGVIGGGWATNFLMAGLKPILYDIDTEKLHTVKKQIQINLKAMEKEGVITPEQYESYLSSVIYTTDPALALEDADFIQENGPENLALKQKIVETMETYAKPDATIASSTSGLLISDIAAKAKYPERFIGGHPYNPVHLIPLVELTCGEKTAPKVIEEAIAFYKEIKKEPILLRKEALGFISNRIQSALYREAADLVNRGVCTLEEIDRAVCYGPGLRYGLMGPNAIWQLGGGSGGLHGLLSTIGATIPIWWKDMAVWTDWPEGYIEGIQAQMDEAMALRDELHGHTNEEMAAFRDKGLVMMLRYHGKL